MSEKPFVLDDLFGVDELIQDRDSRYRVVPLCRGLVGYRAWVADGEPCWNKQQDRAKYHANYY